MKKRVAAISLLMILPSIGFAQSSVHQLNSTEGAGRTALIIDIGQLHQYEALEPLHAGQALHLGLSQAPPNTRGGHPVLIGAAIGGGTGALLNVTACRTGESVCTPPGTVLMAGIGAGIGALVGVLLSRH